MGDARRGLDLAEERLPWLTAPRGRPAKRAAAKRSSSAPIFAILSLFLLASIGVIAFLVGRGSSPVVERGAPVVPRETGQATLSLPPAAVRTPPPAPVAAAAAEPAAPVVVRKKTVRVAKRAAIPVKKAAPPPRISPRAKAAAAQIAAASRSRGTQRRRPVVLPRVYAVVPSPAKPGRVIQIGVYTNHRQAEAGWRRVVAAYPYLGKLPKAVVPARGLPGQPVYYRLQLGARTKSDARALCRNLLSIGRGCRVV